MNSVTLNAELGADKKRRPENRRSIRGHLMSFDELQNSFQTIVIRVTLDEVCLGVPGQKVKRTLFVAGIKLAELADRGEDLLGELVQQNT